MILSFICGTSLSLIHLILLCFSAVSLLNSQHLVANAQTIYCTADSPCVNAACCQINDGETQGICGYGPYCETNCVSNCTATAECGKYADPVNTTCPLNVCCSQYGFCGTTSDFCEDLCQSNCFSATEPSCSSNDVLKRVIGYYESWSSSRSCDSWRPGDIAASSLTHINFAFALFEPTDAGWGIYFDEDETDDFNSLMTEFIGLKDTNPGLSCFLSIGGWSFNDPPTSTYWSDMASTSSGRKSWAKDVLRVVQEYGFDGVDLDWEYPQAVDRGGSPDDGVNYVLLLQELRSVFDASGTSYGISFTIPSSYWYLQGFDIVNMTTSGTVDWVNVMTYDLHGVWDGDDPYIGAILGAHTNLTEIEEALDLLWRNDIDPSMIVLGMGFYGRSFTMSDPSCSQPGCPFSGAGNAGPCTATDGILSYKEILGILADEGSFLTWNEEAAVNYLTYDTNQWVSFDNNQTFKQKVDFANDHCLGGVMIWAVDLDTYDWQALAALEGKDVDGASMLSSGSLNDEDASELATAYSAYTGTDCYVTGCLAYNSTSQCKSGYSVLEYVHAGSYGTITKPDSDLCKVGTSTDGEDPDSEYRLICCPTQAMPEGCSWGGGNSDGLCTGGGADFCGDGKFELIQDVWTERTGETLCTVNARSLCCNSNPELELCSWTSCGGSCGSDEYTFTYETFWDGSNLDPSDDMCLDQKPIEGELAEFCCPSEDTYSNCEWLADDYCTKSCPSGKVLITQRSEVVNIQEEDDYLDCLTGYVKLCCDPPDATSNWPVDPDDLFTYPDETDVSWYDDVEETANDDATDDDSEDPFAFVMIDGDTAAYDESLVDQWSFLDDDDGELKKRGAKITKRDIFTVRNDTFDNVVERYRIQCTSLFVNETGCQSIFIGGASNTIVKMPSNVGAGPYARVISLIPEGSLVNSTASKRASTQVYELTVDYDLAAASVEEKGDVNFRIDYTNLLSYWDEVTDSPASKNRKRWFGSFSAWLAKVTTIVKDEKGYLPLEYDETIKLFHFQKYCPATNLETTLDLDANIHVGLDAQYAYYFEGSILPSPTLISAYGYFSVQPVAAILMTLRGEATIQTNSDTVNIISDVTFPGLSIKGLISIGPTFAMTGAMDASLSVSGEINAGVSVAWERAEVYFPQDSDGEAASVPPTNLDDAGDTYPQTYSVQPELDASISAQGNLALTLTPEVKFGISVLSGDLMEGYVTAGLSNIVSLGVSADASVNLDGEASAEFCYWADYVYSVFLAADVSFLGDLLYWGDSYEVLSPDDPLTLVETTCISYSNSDATKHKRDTGSLVANTTGTPCFGGIIECGTTEETSSCSLDDSGSTESKRATCYPAPGMFYNCDYFPTVNVANLNENTMQNTPYVTFIGICQNVRNFLQSTSASAKLSSFGNNWATLTYYPGTSSGNRNDACSAVSRSCAATKTAMWPTSVQQAAATPAATTEDYQLMNGYSNSISCDEFPFNASEEGGTGAAAACVYNAQQYYQSQVNGLVSAIYDTDVGRQWSYSVDSAWTNDPRTYTITLMSAAANGGNLGSYAGTYQASNGVPIAYIVGGVNTFGNPKYTLTNNAICQMDAFTHVEALSRVEQYYVAPCQVLYESLNGLLQHGVDPNDANNWRIEGVELLEGWEEEATFLDGTPLLKKNRRSAEAGVTSMPGAAATGITDSINIESHHLHGHHGNRPHSKIF